jgi:hypothetical protein
VSTRQTFSDELEAWLDGDGPKTLGSLSTVFAEKAFAVTILLLMTPEALPIPSGGVTYVLEAIAVVIAAQMVLGRRTLWLPERWKGRELGHLTTAKAIPLLLRAIRRLERWSRPRGARLFGHRWATRVCGLLLASLAISASLAPPFSGLDTLPALGAVAICLAILLEDVVVLAAGIVIGTAGTVLILTVGAAAVRLFQRLF